MLHMEFTNRQVCLLTGLSSRQLRYWCRTGLLIPAARTHGGHARYSFADLIALKAACRLRQTGVSVQNIRCRVRQLIGLLERCPQPLQELSLVITRDVVLVLHAVRYLDALDSAECVLPVAELVDEIEAMRHEMPFQGELFEPRSGRNLGAPTVNAGARGVPMA